MLKSQEQASGSRDPLEPCSGCFRQHWQVVAMMRTRPPIASATPATTVPRARSCAIARHVKCACERVALSVLAKFRGQHRACFRVIPVTPDPRNHAGLHYRPTLEMLPASHDPNRAVVEGSRLLLGTR